MPCMLQPCDFECVRSFVLQRIAHKASDPNRTGWLFLTPQNLHYIFCQYILRYEAETGWEVDPVTYSLDTFCEVMYELYWNGMCKYTQYVNEPTRLEEAERVSIWTEESIRAIVFEALKATRKKVNWLTRERDPLYGTQTWNPIELVKPKVSRVEDSYRANFAQMGCGRQPHCVLDHD